MSRSQTWPQAGVRAAVAAAVALVLVATYLFSLMGAGEADAGTGADTRAISAPAKQSAVAAARTAVRTAVQKARRGAPIPRKTTPPMSSLDGSRFDLGECDYGKRHDDAGGRLCPRGDQDADRVLVVMGDSHGKHWVAGVQKAAKRHGWTAYYLVKEQCTASVVANGDPDKARPTEPWAACQDFRDFAIQSVDDLDPDLVIVSTSTPTKGVFTDDGYVNNQKDMVAPFKAGFRTLFRRLHAGTDGRVVLLRDVPARKAKTDPLSCFRKKGNDLGDCLSPENSQAGRVKLVDASVAAAKASDVTVVDPTSFFCWDGVCPASVGNGLLPYRNTSHITVDYSAHLSEALTELLKLK